MRNFLTFWKSDKLLDITLIFKKVNINKQEMKTYSLICYFPKALPMAHLLIFLHCNSLSSNINSLSTMLPKLCILLK